MGFNRKDLEDDDDGFNFDDDSSFDFGDNSDTGDDFKFDDEPSDIGLDDDAGGFGFEDEDMPEIEEEQSEGGGVSRTFIIIAAVMILLFVLGLAAVLFVSTQNNQPSEFEQTRDAIVAINATTAADALLTETAKAINAGTETAIALLPTNTATPAPTDTVAAPPTFTPTPTLDETQQAAAVIQTQQAFDLTQTAEFLLIPPTATTGVGPEGVSLTATALALLLAPGQETPIAVPTQEGIPGVVPTALPDTGFFDDLATGNGNVGMIALMAFGLAGVILVSRRLRTANK